MGGAILIVIVGLVILLLLTPAMRARAARRRDEIETAAHDAVVRRLEDEREKRARPRDDQGR
jgi:hypothetical protein